MQSISEALFLKDELDVMRPLDSEQENRIMQKFRLDWNYHSNHLEGNSLSYGETKALLLFGITAQGKPLADHIEMQGHSDAVNWIIDIVKGARPLNETFIRELHTLLLQKPYEVKAVTAEGNPTTKVINIGQYKRQPNHVKTVTEEIFYFSSPDETPAMMEALIDWYREMDGNPGTNHILLAAEFHYRFIRIHPFDDGNGRTARLLMNFILIRHGYPPIIIKTEDKANYLSALQQADAGILESFIDYIGKNLIDSLNLMIRGARGENIEDVDDFDKKIEFFAQMLEVDTRKVRRSEQIVESMIRSTLLPLFESLVDEGLKFSKFYDEFLPFVSWDSTLLPRDIPKLSKLDQLRNVILIMNNDVAYLIINLWGFRHPNHKDYRQKMIVKIVLMDWSFTISGGDVSFTRTYQRDLDEVELFSIVRSVGEQHLASIASIFSEETKTMESK